MSAVIKVDGLSYLLFRKSWINHENDTVDGQRSFSDISTYDNFSTCVQDRRQVH